MIKKSLESSTRNINSCIALLSTVSQFDNFCGDARSRVFGSTIGPSLAPVVQVQLQPLTIIIIIPLYVYISVDDSG